MRLGSCGAELRAKSVHSHPVQDSEVDNLGTAPHFCINFVRRNAEHLYGNFLMHISSALKYFTQFFVTREYRRDA